MEQEKLYLISILCINRATHLFSSILSSLDEIIIRLLFSSKIYIANKSKKSFQIVLWLRLYENICNFTHIVIFLIEVCDLSEAFCNFFLFFQRLKYIPNRADVTPIYLLIKHTRLSGSKWFSRCLNMKIMIV